MLPGIRFIFVTVILSASVLIFGLGAAALLRASHEEFATLPSATLPPWRTAQSQFPPVPVETNGPTLAMLRIETPEVVKADEAVESPDPTPALSLDEGPNLLAAPDKSNVTTETAPQPEAPQTSAEKGTDIGGQPDPVPADSPAPSAIAAAPAPAIEKQEDGVTGPTESGSTKSEAAAPEAQADQSKAAEAKPEKAETANIQIAKIDAAEPYVAITKMTETTGREVKLRMIKVHATKAKPVAKKAKRSGIYAMAQRRRAAARARAIARARAAQLAQQRLAAMNPFAALFGVPIQPAEVVHTPHQ